MLTVNGGGGFNCSAHSAEPTPKACRLVHWFFGVLVVGVYIAIQNIAAAKAKLAKRLFEGALVVLWA